MARAHRSSAESCISGVVHEHGRGHMHRGMAEVKHSEAERLLLRVEFPAARIDVDGRLASSETQAVVVEKGAVEGEGREGGSDSPEFGFVLDDSDRTMEEVVA